MATAGDSNRRQLSRSDALLTWLLPAAGICAAILERNAVPWLAGLVILAAATVAGSRRAWRWLLTAGIVAALLLARDVANLQSGPQVVDVATELNARFTRLVATLQESVAAAEARLGDAGDSSLLFERLAGLPLSHRHGLSVYGDSEIRAWSGRNWTLPADDLGPGTRVIEVPGGAVVTVGVDTPAGLIVAEAPLATIAPIKNLLIEVARGPGADLDERGEPSAGRTALRGRDGQTVVEVRTPAAYRVARRPLLEAIVGFALTGWLLVLATTAGRQPRPALAALLLVAARLTVPSVPLANLGSLFGHSSLAVAAPFGLFASAGDLMMTGLLFAGLAALSLRLPGLPVRASKLRGPLFVAVAAASAVGMVGYVTLIERVASNSDVDLAQFAVVPFDATRLAVLLGLTLIALGYVLVASVAVDRTLPTDGTADPGAALAIAAMTWLGIGLAAAYYAAHSGWVDPWPAVVFYLLPGLLGSIDRNILRRHLAAIASLACLAVGLVLLTLCQHQTARSLHRFIEHDLAESIRRQDASIRWLLESVLAELDGSLGDSIAFRDPDEQAYLVWSRTQLGRESLRSAVDVRATDGRFGRFSFRLPVPASIGTLLPGELSVQEMQFQGREMKVLAGAHRLEDGARVTVRIGEDSRGIRFFPDVHHLIEVLKPSRVPHLEPLMRFEVELMVVDGAGRVVHSSSPRVLPIGRKVILQAQESAESFWWTARVDGTEFDALTFAASDQILTLSVPREDWSERLAAVINVALFLVVVGSLTFVVITTTVPAVRLRVPGLSWIRQSYDRMATAGIAAGAIAPALLFSLYLRSTIETQSLDAVRAQSVRSLEFARRVLAEFVAADPGAAIDDSTLIWVSQTVGHDLALFRDSSLEATSMRELFREGLLSERPSATSFRAVMLEGAPVHVDARKSGDRIAFEASTRHGDDGLLTLFTVPNPSTVGRPAEERSRLLFLATVGLVLLAALLARLVARQTTRPVRALTDATARVAAGDFAVRIESQRHDEIQTLVESFNRMAETLSVQSAELRGRAAYLSRLLDNAPTGVISIDGDGIVGTVNVAALSLLGEEIVVGASLPRSLHGSEYSSLEAAIASDRRTELELELPTISGTPRMARVVVLSLPLGDAEPPGRLILLEEITELVKSKKLEAWAEMARRVAHEIKNPLTPIQLAAEHAQRVWRDGGLDFDTVLGSCVSTILRQVHEMRRIVREFSSYAAGPRPVELIETDVATWLDELVEPYRAAPPPGVELRLASGTDCGTQPMDVARLRRAAINLIENALAAVVGGGHVCVGVSRSSQTKELLIEVSDDGVGIPEELRDRIFEPYFSTRDTGTGLGLANAKRTVEDHGGRIEVIHLVEGGTTMRLILPAVKISRQAGEDLEGGADPTTT